MLTLAIDASAPAALHVNITDESLSVDLDDGRTITVPLAWYPRLLYSTPEERNNWRLIGKGEGIHWPEPDEDISVSGLLAGRRSGESHRSFRKWLEKRSDKQGANDESLG